MPVEQLRENLRFHFALPELFVALLVFGVVLRVRINRREKNDVLPIRRPDRAVGAGRDVCDLVRLAIESAAFRCEVAHPDLRGISRLRCPDQPFAIGRKPRPLFVIRRLIQPARFPARRRHDPEMRNLGVRLEVHIDRVEHDPFPARRRHRRADPLQFHHVLECERPFAARCRRGWRSLREG